MIVSFLSFSCDVPGLLPLGFSGRFPLHSNNLRCFPAIFGKENLNKGPKYCIITKGVFQIGSGPIQAKKAAPFCFLKIK